MVQFLEGGTLESHIQRHHQAGGGKKGASKGSSGKEEYGTGCGYAFTDERGMIWFDEEEEWEFACLIPKVERPREKGLLKMFGTKVRGDDADEWEQFGEEDTMGSALEDEDEGEWDEDELASFGGDVASRRPAQSVLKMPKDKKDKKKGIRRRRSKSKASLPRQPPSPRASRSVAPTHLKEEFLATSFTPSPSKSSPPRPTPSTSSKPRHTANPTPTPTTPSSRFALFKRVRSASHFNITTTSSSTLPVPPPTKKTPYSKPNTANNGLASLSSMGAGGGITWNWTEMPKVVPQPRRQETNSSDERPSTSTSGGERERPSVDSVKPSVKAAKRLGIEGGVVVSLVPESSQVSKTKKGFFGRK